MIQMYIKYERSIKIEMGRNTYDVDENLKEYFNFKQLIRFLSYLKKYKLELVITIILMTASSALALLTPKVLVIILDTYIPNKDIEKLIETSIFLLIINGVISVFQAIKISLTAKVGQNVVFQIREDIFQKIQYLPFSFYDDKPHGKIQVRIVNYVNSLSDLITNGIVNTITDLFSLIFIIFFMLSINVRLTLICLLGLPLLFGVIFIMKKKQRYIWQVSSNKISNLNALISESMYGIRTIKSFGQEKKTLEKFNSLSMESRNAWIKASKLNMILWPVIINISVWTTAFIYVYGVICVDKGIHGITIGVIIAMSSYIDRFWLPINTFANFYNSLITTVAYLERIFETIDEPILVKDCDNSKKMKEINGEIEFKDVNFSYEPGKKILKHISFHVKPGQTIGIVGPTGSGKTTIVNLINRFYPIESDKIYIDGIDISKVKIESLRQQIGIMMQDSFLFSGTIMDNIRYGNLAATDEEVIEASKRVRANEFITKLENGYHTKVNEKGSKLSAGQRQLLSFARVIISNPKILILDEATSSIDTETEALLQEGLTYLLKGKTSFIIAHRLSTIRQCDSIFYIQDGEILECGSHEELLSKKGLYYNLYTSQFLAKE